MCLSNDRYLDYSVSVHEFAHTIEDILTNARAFANSQPTFSDLLNTTHEQAQLHLPCGTSSYAISELNRILG